MKTRITLSKRSLQVYITVISVICISCCAFAMEPIGTIGQPFPEQHAFLSNEAIVRVTPARIQIIDTNTGALMDEFAEREYFSDVVLSPDASHLAILTHAQDGKSTTVSIWDVNAREQISEWRVEFRIYDVAEVAAFSPTDPLFAIPSEDAIHLWNWQTGESLGRMTGTRRPLQSCHFFDGGSSCEGDPRDHTAIFSPEGRYLIIASMRPDIELWNIGTRQLEGHFEGHTGNWVEKAAISPDGRYIASFESNSTSVYVWDVESRQLRWKAKSGIGTISDVVFSPDSQHLYVATWIATVGVGDWQPLSILDTQNPEKSQELTSENGPVSLHDHYQIVFSENDEYFAASGSAKDNQDWIQLWKREGDTFVFQYARQVPDLLYSPIPTGDYSSQAQAVYWDGRNQMGEPVSSGVYLYTINTGDFSATRKMLIRK